DTMTVQRLLRGKVVRSAEHVFVVFLGERIVLVIKESSQTQVQNFHGAVAIKDDIPGLDIAMDQACDFVGVLQSERRLADVMSGANGVEWPDAVDNLL